MVLINGLTDAEYLIDSVEWEAIFVPDAAESNPHGSFVEGTMEIKEPMGVRFLNLLKLACDNLKSDPSGLTFVLKTVFVGWNDGSSGTEGIQQVVNVNPLSFVIMDLQAEFTTVGSNYTVQFVGQCNGVSRMPQYGTVQQSGLKPAGTLGAAVQNLMDQMNQSSKDAYTKLVAQLDESNNTQNTQQQNNSPKGRLVQYNFIIDAQFASMAMDNVNPRLTQSSSDSPMGTPQGLDIESALTDIMLSSTELMKRHNENIKQGFKEVFKIESAIDSDLNTVTVIVNIKACKVPVLVKDNTNNAGTVIQPNVYGRAIIEFEYIYTGKNIEILDYDMKMTMGMQFFQQYATTNVLPGNFSTGSGNVQTIASGPGSTLIDGKNPPVMRELTPIPMPAQVQDPNAKNKPAAADTANFRMFMARWAFAESIQTRVRIAGIPKLLDGFNLITKDVLGTVCQVESFPLIDIHVKMPNRDSDFRAGTANYADDFWYHGHFQILSVKNMFRDGRFEQELEINAITYEELAPPQGGGSAGSGTGSSSGTSGTPNSAASTPATANQTQTSPSATGTPKTTQPPAITPEQKAKHDDTPPTLPADIQLNCDTMLKYTYKTLADTRKVRLSQNFTLDMFIRRDINVTNDQRILTNLCRVAAQLELVKAWLGLPMVITSGYRSPAFNNSVKGASTTSDHMKGLAVDCQFPGTLPQVVWNKLKTSPFKFRQCIWEHFGSSSWVHMAFDVDPGYPVQKTATFFELPHSGTA